MFKHFRPRRPNGRRVATGCALAVVATGAVFIGPTDANAADAVTITDSSFSSSCDGNKGIVSYDITYTATSNKGQSDFGVFLNGDNEVDYPVVVGKDQHVTGKYDGLDNGTYNVFVFQETAGSSTSAPDDVMVSCPTKSSGNPPPPSNTSTVTAPPTVTASPTTTDPASSTGNPQPSNSSTAKPTSPAKPTSSSSRQKPSVSTSSTQGGSKSKSSGGSRNHPRGGTASSAQSSFIGAPVGETSDSDRSGTNPLVVMLIILLLAIAIVLFAHGKTRQKARHSGGSQH